jgi:hypothetical protein
MAPGLAAAWAEKRRAAGLVAPPSVAPPAAPKRAAPSRPRRRPASADKALAQESVIDIWLTPTERALLERLHRWCAAHEGATGGIEGCVSSAIACLVEWPIDAQEPAVTAKAMARYRAEWLRERQTIPLRANLDPKVHQALERVASAMGWSPDDAARYAIRHLCDVYDDQEDLGAHDPSPAPAQPAAVDIVHVAERATQLAVSLASAVPTWHEGAAVAREQARLDLQELESLLGVADLELPAPVTARGALARGAWEGFAGPEDVAQDAAALAVWAELGKPVEAVLLRWRAVAMERS